MTNNTVDTYTKGMVHWEASDNEAMSKYSSWQAGLAIPYLGKRVMEIGAGGGRITSLLNSSKNFDRYVALEPSQEFFAQLSKQCPNMEILNRSVEELGPEFNNSFDTIVMIHVLEHIENDSGFLEEISRILTPQGKIVLMVPALQFLMSDLDRNIGHMRRYNKKMIRDIAKELNYEIIANKYNNLIGVFGWLWLCKIRKIHYQTKKRKKVLLKSFKIFDDYFLPAISYIEQYIPPPIGLNLTAVLQKG